MSVHDDSVAMVVVAVDVSKNTVALSVTDAQRHRPAWSGGFRDDRAGVIHSGTGPRCAAAGVQLSATEAAGHYRRPLLHRPRGHWVGSCWS